MTEKPKRAELPGQGFLGTEQGKKKEPFSCDFSAAAFTGKVCNVTSQNTGSFAICSPGISGGLLVRAMTLGFVPGKMRLLDFSRLLGFGT